MYQINKTFLNLPENHIFKKLHKNEKIAGDLGFKGLESLSIYTHITGKKTSSQKRFNREFKHYWSVLENSISHLRKWKICSNRFDMKVKQLPKALEKHDFIIQIVAGLVNKFVMPLRIYD